MKRSKIKRREKMEGEHYSYFFWRNLIAIWIFFTITVQMGIFDITSIDSSYIITWGFVESVFWILIISCVADGIGRFAGYYLIIVPASKYIFKRDYKSFKEISEGFNRFSHRTVISLFIASLLFSIGAIWLIHEFIFEENTFWSLVLAYAILKIGIYLSVKFFIK